MNPSRSLLWLASLPLLAGLALAQPAPAPESGMPPSPNAPSAANANVTLYGLTASPGGDVNAMNISDLPLAAVLKLLEDLTGRMVIRPQNLPTPTFAFKSNGPLSRQDAVIAIESLLSINGIAIAPLGDKFIKIVGTERVSREAPELVVGSLQDRPPSGRIVSKLFRLQHLDLNSFQQQIQPFLSQGFGTFVPFQNSSTVLVTDTVSNLQRLEYVINEVDKPRNITTKFYQLKYATAQAVADKIRSLIESTRSAFNRAGQQGGAGQAVGAPLPQPGQPMPTPQMQGAGDGATAALLSANVSLNFDERTNQIILVSDPTSVQFFDNLIEKLDVQADLSTQIRVIQLQYANATEVASLLTSFVGGGSQSQTRSGTTGARNTNNRNAQNGAGTGGVLRNTSLRNTFGTQSSVAGQGPQQPLPQPAGGGGGGGERGSQFSGAVSVLADDRSNAIIASGTLDDLTLLTDLIHQIDVVLPQVQIDVLIVTATLDDNRSRGLDLFSGIEIVDNKITKIGEISGPGIALTSIIPKGDSRFDLTAVIKTVNEKSKVRVLSVPSITTSHNQAAMIIVGDSIPIRTSSVDNGTVGGGVRDSFTYQDIGLQLEVTPLIGSDGVVQLEINQSADERTSGPGIDGQPIISRRQAQSFVSVRSGEIIVLGGLQKVSTVVSGRGIPILGEIPVLRWIFGSSDNQKGRDEVMFFIQPRVLLNPSQANDVGKAMIERSALKKELKIQLDASKFQPIPDDEDEKAAKKNKKR